MVKRLGDPRNHSSAARLATLSPGVKHSGGGGASVAASTAPFTVSGDLDASPLDSTSAKKPVAATAPLPAPPGQVAIKDRSFFREAVSTPRTIIRAPSSAEGTAARLPLAGNGRTPAATIPLLASPVRDASTDRSALLVLYYATNGPPERSDFFWLKKGGWKSRKGWETSRPIGEWHGVTVDAEGRVIKLELEKSNLSGGCRWFVVNLKHLMGSPQAPFRPRFDGRH